MPDAIPSAKYYDKTFDDEFICNGVVDEEDITYVVAEYDEYGEISIPLTAFKHDAMIELIELPEDKR